MAYNVLHCSNLVELATRRGNANPLIGTILGLNYPLDEAFTVYEWKNTDTTTPDGYEVLASTSGDTTTGRWHRVENAQLPQVNADWNSTSGPSNILNKPAIPSGQVPADWGATTGISRILNKPIIPDAQVRTDWNATSGVAFILNKPSISTVATTGLYSDLSGKPTFSPVALSGTYSDLSGRPLLSALAISGSWSDITGKPVFSAVAVSGNYSDLAGRPVIPAGQVNSDWTATSGLSQILNRPSLATVSTSGSYADLTNKPQLSTVAATGNYSDLLNVPTIPAAISFAAPVTRALALATAYQATTSTKPSILTVTLTSTSSVSLAGTVNNIANIVIGATSAVAAGTGTIVGAYENTLGGGLVVGLNLTNKATNTYTVTLPSGWFFAIRQTVGTGVTIVSAFDQQVG